jgi:cysteine desulfurase
MDHHATTPCDPRVVAAMYPYFTYQFGNPSSTHEWGQAARRAVALARREVANLIGASEREIVFTSGATEAVSLAMRGLVEVHGCSKHKDHIVTVKTEHKAVLKTCEWLVQHGMSVTFLGVDSKGLLDPDDVRKAITPRTLLVSVMAANNEVGVLQPLVPIGNFCREHEVYFMSDATQAVGKVPFDVGVTYLDLACLSGHKMYGPKGIGALFVRQRRPRVRISPQILGGEHERGLRSGTLNVPAIVGLGKACEFARLEQAEDSRRIGKLRDELLDMLVQGVPDAVVHGSLEHRLPHNLNISFPGVAGDSLVASLEGIALSTGSACMTVLRESSYVLRALGVPEETAFEAVRFGLGRINTQEEVGEVAMQVVEKVHELRAAR